MTPQNPLYMTKYSAMLTKDELKAAINKEVEMTQSRSIILPLPDLLLLRKDQYDLLIDDPDLQKMYQSEDRLYATPLNVMEVRVQT